MRIKPASGIYVAALVASAMLVLPAFAKGDPATKLGKPAPAISGKTWDGKAFDLKSALAKGPVLVYFIATDCPVTVASAPHYGKIADAYKGSKVTMVGVTNADKAGTETWARKFYASYPILPGDDYKTIRAYGVERGPTAVLIGTDGKIAKVWDGYSNGYLQEANTVCGKASGKATANLTFKGAPKDVEAG